MSLFFCGINCKRYPGSIPFKKQNSLYVYIYQYSPTANQIARMLKKRQTKKFSGLSPKIMRKVKLKEPPPTPKNAVHLCQEIMLMPTPNSDADASK